MVNKLQVFYVFFSLKLRKSGLWVIQGDSNLQKGPLGDLGPLMSTVDII